MMATQCKRICCEAKGKKLDRKTAVAMERLQLLPNLINAEKDHVVVGDDSCAKEIEIKGDDKSLCEGEYKITSEKNFKKQLKNFYCKIFESSKQILKSELNRNKDKKIINKLIAKYQKRHEKLMELFTTEWDYKRWGNPKQHEVSFINSFKGK